MLNFTGKMNNLKNFASFYGKKNYEYLKFKFS